VGGSDAQALAKGFSFFSAEDLQSLPIGKAIVRTEQAQFDFSVHAPAPNQYAEISRARENIVAHSRAQYAVSKEAIA